jgi:hypothetical protein
MRWIKRMLGRLADRVLLSGWLARVTGEDDGRHDP